MGVPNQIFWTLGVAAFEMIQERLWGICSEPGGTVLTFVRDRAAWAECAYVFIGVYA